MDKRIKELRTILGLTQEEFGRRIGVKPNTIATYEMGRNEPVNSIVRLICIEFNVDETWLRTGEGEMFIQPPDDALEMVAREYGLSVKELALLQVFVELPSETRKSIIEFVGKFAKQLNTLCAVDERERLHEELDRQFALEEKGEAKSEVS